MAKDSMGRKGMEEEARVDMKMVTVPRCMEGEAVMFVHEDTFIYMTWLYSMGRCKAKVNRKNMLMPVATGKMVGEVDMMKVSGMVRSQGSRTENLLNGGYLRRGG
jgi:hypothetical protein